MLVTRREVAWLFALIGLIIAFKVYNGPSDVEMAQSWPVKTVPATTEPFAPPPGDPSTTTTTTEVRPVVTTATGVWIDDPMETAVLAMDDHDTESVIPDDTPLPPGITRDPDYDPGTFRCWEWIDMAVDVGWGTDRLDVLDNIMYRESRCDPSQVSPTNDWGLLQVNRKVWRPYVESFGLTMDDLLVPQVNLWIGLQIANIAEYDYGWDWCQPWYMSGPHTC